MSPKCLASMEGIRSETVNKQLVVAILYMTVKFSKIPRTSAVTSPGIQTTTSNQHKNMRTESMTPMSLFYLPWFSRPKLISLTYPAAHLQLLRAKNLQSKHL